MKKAKLVLWLIIIGFIGLVIFQNKGFFLTRQSFGVNLLFFNYRTPEIYSAILFVAFFLFGALIAYFFSLFERFRTNKTIKALNTAVTGYQQSVTALKAEVAGLKNTAPPLPSEEVTDPGADPSQEAASTL